VLVHGSGANERQWTELGVGRQADSLAHDHQIAPIVIVMPDEDERPSPAQAADVAVLPAWADARFRTVADAAHRGIGGISRGGAAAIRAAAAPSSVYGVVEGNSPAIVGDTAPLVAGLRTLSGDIRLDVGESDRLEPSVRAFARRLRADGTQVVLAVRPGSHDRAYWSRNVDAYLRFFAARWR
jgi:enterochelin esterase-like enzyme